MSEMVIRPESARDAKAIFAVVTAAFGQDGEARLVDALRGTQWWIPELSLVAEEDGEVVGHVLFSRVEVRDGEVTRPALALAPVAVVPPRQSSGIGSRLIREGLARARDLGEAVVIVLGHATYYPRFGFVRAIPQGIRYPGPVNDASFMVAELVPGKLA